MTATNGSFRRGMTTRIDFLEELGSTATLEFEITEVIGIHDDHDLALLRVEQRIVRRARRCRTRSRSRQRSSPISSSATSTSSAIRPGTAAATSPSRFGASSRTSTTSSGCSPGKPSDTRPPTPPSSTTAPRSAGTLAHRSWTWRPIRSSACTSGGGTGWGTTPCRSGCSRTIRCSRRPTSTSSSRSLSSVQLGFAPARSAGGPEPVGS